MKSIKKTIGLALLASGGLASGVVAVPSKALALGWDPESMVAQTTGTTGMSAANINQQSLANWVQGFTTFLLGIAIVLFVLKVVLTAVDRMLFKNNIGGGSGGGGSNPMARTAPSGGGGSGSGFSLANIPIIGAYPQDTEWKDVFIHFGKNVAIVAGAWVLVQIVVGVILFVFGTITNGVA